MTACHDGNGSFSIMGIWLVGDPNRNLLIGSGCRRYKPDLNPADLER